MTLSRIDPGLLTKVDPPTTGAGEHKVGAPPWSLGPDPLDPQNHPSPQKAGGWGDLSVPMGLNPDSKVVRPFISPTGCWRVPTVGQFF